MAIARLNATDWAIVRLMRIARLHDRVTVTQVSLHNPADGQREEEGGEEEDGPLLGEEEADGDDAIVMDDDDDEEEYDNDEEEDEEEEEEADGRPAPIDDDDDPVRADLRGAALEDFDAGFEGSYNGVSFLNCENCSQFQREDDMVDMLCFRCGFECKRQKSSRYSRSRDRI